MNCQLCDIETSDPSFYPSIDWALDAAGEDGESAIALCDCCSFAAAHFRLIADHAYRMGDLHGGFPPNRSTISVKELGHLYGCLIDGRTKDMPAYFRDPIARKYISSVVCETHNRRARMLRLFP